MSDLWLITYERALDEFMADRKVIGDQEAIIEFMRKMRALGFDQPEIADHIAEEMS